MSPNTISLILFLVISLATAAVAMLIRDMFVSREAPEEDEDEQQTIPLLPNAVEAPRGPLARFDHWFGRVIAESGVRLSAPAAFLLSVGAGLVLAAGLFLWREDVIIGVAAMLIGFAAVQIFFFYQRSRRHQLMLRQLPPAMELMARSMRAGQSLDQAISLAGDMSEEPIATEFRRCARQLELGLSLEAAVRAVADRVPMPETRIFASTLVVQRRAGGSLPRALLRLAQAFRDRLQFQLRFRAATATARGSAFVITFLALGAASYMAVAQPEMSRNFIETPQGMALLATGLILLIVGLFWVSRILKVRY